MKDKKLPNRLTNLRLIISIIIVIFLLFPFSMVNINFKKYLVNDTVIIDLKMIIAGVLFIIASITDFFDGYLARKHNNTSEYGILMDPISDKILVDSALIILSSYGYIHPIITIIVVLRDIIVNSFRIVAAKSNVLEPSNLAGKAKTFFLMIGIILKMFGNVPFEFIKIKGDDFFLITGTILALISAYQYIMLYKKYIKTNNTL